MWGIPVSLIAGGSTEIVNISMDEYIGDLWIYLGSPSNPVNVNFTVDAADAAEIIIPLNFAAGSTFQFNAINGGRFIGTGGVGGAGGDDNGATGDPGNPGFNGGHAIQSDTFIVDIDVDDGYLLGGGGGGGGGSYDDNGATGTPGGGGGGGFGWGDAAGGAAGVPSGSPVATAGGAGSQTTGGMGGAGGTSATNDGGDGSTFGYAGDNGQFADPSTNRFATNQQGNGGVGGNGGSAYNAVNGSVATFNGAKSQATLRTENRIKGETDGVLSLFTQFAWTGFISGSGSSAVGYRFTADADGTFTVETDAPDLDYASMWYAGNTITPANYEVRAVVGTEGGATGWTTDPGTTGDWFTLSVDELWELATTNANGSASGVVEIGRVGESLAIASALLLAGIEYEP